MSHFPASAARASAVAIATSTTSPTQSSPIRPSASDRRLTVLACMRHVDENRFNIRALAFNRLRLRRTRKPLHWNVGRPLSWYIAATVSLKRSARSRSAESWTSIEAVVCKRM